MRYLIFVLVGMFFFSFVSGQASDTEVDFNLPGCTDRDTDQERTNLAENTCSGDGKYFCGKWNETTKESKFYYTREDKYGCSLEFGSVDAIPVERNTCCEDGFLCNETSFVCNQRLVDCINLNTSEECGDQQCFWVEETETCIESASELGCNFYTNEESCEDDLLNLGQIGSGTNICGEYIENGTYVIPLESCECEWETTTCSFVYNVTEVIYTGEANSFKCSKDFETGLCIEGERGINWTASPIEFTGSWETKNDLPNGLLEEAECVSGEEIRFCGSPVIKLPGYGFLELIFSVLIIFGIYYFKRD